MTDPASGSRNAGTRDTRPGIRFFWPVWTALLILRLILDARLELAPDEAFYWTWSRHLAGGYFDHPPMIGLLIWLSTRVFGNTELGVRFFAAVLSYGAVAVLVRLAWRVVPETPAVALVAFMWLASPLPAVVGTIFTPDSPAVFFSVCALTCAVNIARADDEAGEAPASLRRWILFGVFCGLALLSKYTTVLLPAGVGIALLTTPRGRAHLGRPGPYLAAFAALLIFSPVIWWNWNHQWVSFLFQLRHGAADTALEPAQTLAGRLLHRAAGLAEFLGGQAFVWTPILFGITLVVLWTNLRRYSKLPEAERVLLWCGLLPLIVFGWASTRARGEINWPAFAYFPVSLLIARWAAAGTPAWRAGIVKEGCKLALTFCIVLHLIIAPGVPGLLARANVRLPHSLSDLFGWRAFGRELADAAHGAPVVCNRHQDAGEAAFYMPGQPDVWCVSVGSRPTAFDYYDVAPDFQHMPRVLWVGGHLKQFMDRYGFTRSQTFSLTIPGPGLPRVRPVSLVSR